MILTSNITDYQALIKELGQRFSNRAEQNDQKARFAFENYGDLKLHRFFSLLVPTEFGGAGLSHAEVCDIIRQIAHHCGSTALALSMHQHLVGASVWKYKHKGVGAEMLTRVAREQIILISTGARDWLGSNGSVKKVEGGYLVSGRKAFASQSAFGDIAITSAPYRDENNEWKVIHFPVPLNAPGVSLDDDWDTLGMRATGSQTIIMEDVFIPEAAIALIRNRNEFHPVWNMILTVAMPLIMSAYLGLAEKAYELAVNQARKKGNHVDILATRIGKLHNDLIAAQVQWEKMHTLTNNFDFTLDQNMTVEILSLKTNVSEACRNVVEGAVEMIGGQSFYKINPIERIFRDIQAAQFHPLAKWDQYLFTGQQILN